MIFKVNNFFCDVDIYRNETDLVVKFYDKAKEHREEQIVNLVIVDPGYGYVNLKLIGKYAGLLSGFLDENIFSTDDLIEGAIDFVHNLSPDAKNAYVPHHIRKVKFTGYVEYNGEY
jgi:hypothetical protein